MKHYFNKYNFINFSVFLLLVTTAIERLLSFVMIKTALTTVVPLFVFVWSLRLIMVIIIAMLFFTILLEFANRNAEFDYFRNSIKSYVATWKIRRYCTLINIEPTVEESARYTSTKQMIIKKANRSLLTLTVTYYEKKAFLKGRLPANTESSDLIEELLPKIKRELNYLDKNYQFNDIVRDEESRTFSSVAIRKNNNKGFHLQ